MKYVVLNGSPKGNDSATLQYARYLFNQNPEEEVRIYHIGQRILQLEKNGEAFNAILEDIAWADAVIWTFPVYYMAVCAQQKRFIELVFERQKQSVFAGKYTAAIETSIHFHDHTAMNYMIAVSEDMGMRHVGDIRAYMNDLLKTEGRQRLESFGKRLFTVVREQREIQRKTAPVQTARRTYTSISAIQERGLPGKKLIIMDSSENKNVSVMVDRLRRVWKNDVDLVVLEDLKFPGGCQGCIHCGYDNTCIYEGKDAFIPFYEDKVKKADVVIFAGGIQDRYLSATWKRYFDRSFYNTHRPTLYGKQTAMLISGPLEQMANVRQIFETYFQVQMSHFHGFVTDTPQTDTAIDQAIDGLAEDIARGMQFAFMPGKDFLGVGGWKIFRDDIWGSLRFPFRADYKTYRDLKMFDFPHKAYRERLMNQVMLLLTKFLKARKEIYRNRMLPAMVDQHRKIADSVK